MKYTFWFFLLAILIVRLLVSVPHFQDGQILRITGRLSSEPLSAGKNLRFTIRGIDIVTTKIYDIHYGDTVVVKGEYKDGELKNTNIEEIKTPKNIFVNLRKNLISFYQKSLPSPHSNLVAGITIGAKSNLPKELSENLKNTGTSHVVVASGMNLTMVASFILGILLSITKRKNAILITITSIWFYTMITGFDAPILRAAIMATIAFTAQVFGKVASSLRYTLITAFVMLMISPYWLKDVGFQLSFATTIALILFQARVDKMISFVPSVVRGDLSTSIAAQIGSAPIILLIFGRINLLSPIINTLVLWVVSPVMIIGIVSGIIGLIFPQLGRIILLLSYPLTSWFLSVINFFGK